MLTDIFTDIEEETLDISWYGVDDDGQLAHFASGGRGFLPPSIKRSKVAVDQLIDYFWHAAHITGKAIESSRLLLHEEFRTPSEKTRYLRNYCLMAERGLYSFDCVMAPTRPSSYFLVAKPSSPITVNDLPIAVKRIIEATRIIGSVELLDVIDIEMIRP